MANEGRTKKSVTNIVFNLSNQILTLVLAFVSRSVFIHKLGIDYLGLNGLFTDVLGLLSVADLGFNTAMVYSFYKPLANNDREKLAGLITFYRKVYSIIAVAVSVLGVALIPVLPYIINLEAEVPNLYVYYLLALVNVVISYLCIHKTSILTADQKQYKTTLITMIIGIVKTVVQIGVLLLWSDYIIYLVVGCIGVLSANVISSLIAGKEYPYINHRTQLPKEDKRGIYKNVFSVLIYKVSTVLITATDNVLISILIGTVAVGYYSNYLLLQNKIYVFYSLIFTSTTASIGNLIANNKEEKRYEIFACEQVFSYLLCGIIVPCYVLLANDMIGIWLGAEYILPYDLVIATGLSMYLGCVLQPLWSYREATGMYQKTKWVMLICATLNLILSILLGNLIGLTGIILATSISKFATTIWYESKVLFRDYFDKKAKKFYLGLVQNMIAVTLLILLGSFASKNIIIHSWGAWILKACCIGSVSLVLIVLVYIRTSEFKMLKNKAMGIIRRK